MCEPEVPLTWLSHCMLLHAEPSLLSNLCPLWMTTVCILVRCALYGWLWRTSSMHLADITKNVGSMPDGVSWRWSRVPTRITVDVQTRANIFIPGHRFVLFLNTF